MDEGIIISKISKPSLLPRYVVNPKLFGVSTGPMRAAGIVMPEAPQRPVIR